LRRQRAPQALARLAAVDAAVVACALERVAHRRGQDRTDRVVPAAFEGKPVRTCIGGASRAASVLAGLAALPDEVRPDDFVLVHDAARPNLSQGDLSALLERGRADPVGAILAAPVRDTLKIAGDDGGIDGTRPRDRLWRALTPQLFRRLQLARALEAALAEGEEPTDESMAMERQGARPLLVEGSESNLKVTTPADLAHFRFLRSQ
jgi:2-C-methyl-D-erythritol 4-phosphate cytidylyltransferase